jgi:hypothetical protein
LANDEIDIMLSRVFYDGIIYHDFISAIHDYLLNRSDKKPDLSEFIIEE